MCSSLAIQTTNLALGGKKYQTYILQVFWTIPNFQTMQAMCT